MATTRTAKVEAEIEKAKAKLAEQQTRLKELEAKRTELENTEIVDIVRGMSIPLEDLAVLLQSMKTGAGTSGHFVPKSKPNFTQNEKEDTPE
jgi:hypothetical protein